MAGDRHCSGPPDRRDNEIPLISTSSRLLDVEEAFDLKFDVLFFQGFSELTPIQSGERARHTLPARVPVLESRLDVAS
jgi:hypothetical protein